MGRRPLRNYRWVLGSVTDTVSVDSGLSNNDLRRPAVSLRNLRRNDLTFVTAPVAGLDSVQGQCIVRLDERRGQAFWRAVAADDLTTYTDVAP
jgi:hypothetical protein